MLQFILGSAKTGKTTKMKQLIVEECKTLISKNTNKKSFVILIVPEQFTYETEKKLFKELSPSFFRLIKVTSFSRLATEIFSQFGGGALDIASSSAKIALMDITINSLKGEFCVYKKASGFKSFTKLMLDTITELKNAGVSPQQFKEALSQTKGNLNSKGKEIYAVYNTYDALLSASFRDSLDDITRATKIIQSENCSNYFSDCSVFFDEFKGFTANEHQFIKNILQTAKSTTMALCLDLEIANNEENSAFSSVKKVYQTISRFAKEGDCKILSNINLKTYLGYNSAELLHCSKNIFSTKTNKYEQKNKAIFPIMCKNEYDEIDIALSQIKSLIKDENYLYNEIAIISRDLPTYQNKLVVAFKKYEIPFYCDMPQPILQKPLIKLVKNALKCVTDGFKSENILSVLKCGITKFSPQDVAELENYAYVWSLNATAWKNEFTSNPRGYADVYDEDNEVLARINNIRKYIIEALSNFSNAIKNTNVDTSCEAIMTLLSELEIKENTQNIIDKFLQIGDFNSAQEYKNVWEIFVNQINILSITMKNEMLSAQRFAQLFELICAEETIDSLPQSLDCVIVGDAQNIRITDKKAVFILGVNDGIFPFVPKNTGVFTSEERKKLIEFDVNISPPIIDSILEERFIAYRIMTAPTDKLFLTARKADISGKTMQPSTIFSRLKKIFGNDVVLDSENKSGEFFCMSKGMSFTYLAKTYFDDNQLTASLKEIFSQDDFCKSKIEMIEKINKKEPFEIKDSDNCKKIFDDKDKKMNISPTRVESFYQCAFRYFCQHGLRVYPLKKAELNPLETGTLIHKVLFDITKKYDLKNNFDEQKIKAEIKLELDVYIEQVMGGVKDKTKRFMYIYQKIRIQLFKILEHLHNEFEQSQFAPTDYEYEINENSDITPLKMVTNENIEVVISGKIDRIDSYVSQSGQKYIRIVDYKSGKKMFKLNDVLYGLNLQMLIYLFCIENNGKEKYKNCKPAGILYLHAGTIKPNLSRLSTQEQMEKEVKDFYKMNGLLVNETEVLEAMEKGIAGEYIPVSTKNDGTFSSQSLNSLASKQELGKISNYINKLIANMADELHYGKISASPLEGSCEYCDYASVCGKNQSEIEQYKKFEREEIFKQMENFSPEGDSNNG